MPFPTQYQQTGGKTSFTNADLKPEHDLKLLIEKSPSMAWLAGDPSYDEIMSGAHKTLDSTAQTSNKLRAAGLSVSNPGDEQAARAESNARKHQAREVIDAGVNSMAMIPGPVGVAGRVGAGLLGAYDTATEGPSIGNTMQMGLGAIELAPALRALKGESAFMEGVSPRVTGQGRELPYKLPGNQVPPPEGAPYRLGGPNQKFLPDPRQLTSGARQMPVSSEPDPSFVRAEPGQYGHMAYGEDVDLSDELQDLSQPEMSNQERMQAQAKERFGRSFQSESTGAAESAPPTRGLSVGEEQGVQDLGRALETIHGPDWKPKGNGLYKEPSVSPMVSPLRQAALDALAAEDEASKRAVLFGGASSQTEGTFGEYVRPKHRHPIGSGSPRVTPRESNVKWNQ